MPDAKNNLSVRGDVFGVGVPFVVAKRIQHSDFNSAARTLDFNASDLGLHGDHMLLDCNIKVVTAFAGSGITAATVSVSDVTTDDTWIATANVAATGWTGTALADKGVDLNDNKTYIVSSGADLHVRLIVTDADANNLTAGDATIFVTLIYPGDTL